MGIGYRHTIWPNSSTEEIRMPDVVRKKELNLMKKLLEVEDDEVR